MTIELTENEKEKVKKFIELSEKLKNAYFFNSYSNARSRRSFENDNSMSIEFKGIKASIDVKMSCHNVYVDKSIYIDGVKKDIRALKKIV